MSQMLKYYLGQNPLSNLDIINLKKSKKKFTDELFPPNENSLLSANKEGIYLDQNLGEKIAIKFMKELQYNPKWIRISDMPELNKLYDEKNFSFNCILQGSIGDCYLISALCEISQYPKLLINNDKLENSINIINKYDRDIGYYEFKLFIDGEYQLVIIDDFIPYDEDFGDISFAKTSKNFYWVSLIEKAFAKIMGGYSNIINIDDNENEEFKKFKIYNKTNLAFQILTGFIPEKYLFTEYDKDFIYKKLYNDGLYQNNMTKNEILITTGTISKENGVLEENYIPYNHSFSILDIKTVYVDKEEIKLLLLNNPWGKNIYNSNIIGNYIQNTKNEKMKDLNKYIQYNIDSLDGTFWIDFDTFFESFSYISLCKILTKSKIFIYKFDKDIYNSKPCIFNLKILEDDTDVYLSILYERNKYDKKNESKDINCYLILNKINNNNIIEENYSLFSTKEIYMNKILKKGNYHIWLYFREENDENNKFSFKIVYNKNIIIDFNKFDSEFKYLYQVAQEVSLNKKENFKSKDDFNVIDGYNIIDGFYIICFKNKVNNSFKLEYTIEKKGKIEIITKGFKKKCNSNNILYINDTLNNGEVKIYIMQIKERNTSVKTSYTYLKGTKGDVNTLLNKDFSFYNFNNCIESNKNLDGIRLMNFNTPEHKKIINKTYEILNSYEDDNLIKGLNKDRGNKNRQIRAINEDNNIHSFGEFKNSYQNETYSKENIHGFKNKINEKIEIKEGQNKKYFYFKNENSSEMNFKFTKNKERESIFKKNEIKNEKNNEVDMDNNELNDINLISKFIDYMELMERKENNNISYMEVRCKYSKIWNELSDEDKMIYALFFEMEKNNEINIKLLLDDK